MGYYETDSEFMERMEYFTLEEVANEPGQELPGDVRYLAILSVLLGCQGLEVYKSKLPEALEQGVTPVMVKEMVYQAVDYLGLGRVMPFLAATNEILTARGIKLPLAGQATTTLEDRLEKGVQVQAEIFGEHMKEAWKAGHINRWLAENCF